MEYWTTWYTCGVTLHRTGHAKESSNCNAAGDPEVTSLEFSEISGGSIQSTNVTLLQAAILTYWQIRAVTQCQVMDTMTAERISQ